MIQFIVLLWPNENLKDNAYKSQIKNIIINEFNGKNQNIPKKYEFFYLLIFFSFQTST